MRIFYETRVAGSLKYVTRSLLFSCRLFVRDSVELLQYRLMSFHDSNACWAHRADEHFVRARMITMFLYVFHWQPYLLGPRWYSGWWQVAQRGPTVDQMKCGCLGMTLWVTEGIFWVCLFASSWSRVWIMFRWWINYHLVLFERSLYWSPTAYKIYNQVCFNKFHREN